MSDLWTPCEFDTFTNPQLRAEFAAYSRIGCAALNCVEVDPVTDSYQAFNKLVSLFCIVGENTKELNKPENETDQLLQTTKALNALVVFPRSKLLPFETFLFRIYIYTDAAIRISTGGSAGANPIVEIL